MANQSERRDGERTRLRMLNFTLAGYAYVAALSEIRAVVSPQGLAAAPAAPVYVAGLLREQGQTFPVVDLKKKLGLAETGLSAESSVIVVDLAWGRVGFLADAVADVEWAWAEDFPSPSPVIVPLAQRYIRGMAHLGDRTRVWLDLVQLLSPEDQLQLQSLPLAEERPAVPAMPAAKVALLTFEVAEAWLGVPLPAAVEITRSLPVMPLPYVPDYVKGVVNHRGRIWPLLDLHALFGLPAVPGEENRLLFIKGGGFHVALAVDGVSGIVRLPVTAFQPVPERLQSGPGRYGVRLVRDGERILIELDTARLLAETALKGEKEDRV